MLLLIALACTDKPADDSSAPIDPLSWALGEPGPYQVGYRSWTLEYAAPPLGETRSIGVNLWYPTEATDGGLVSYLGIYPDADALGDAPPAPPVYDGAYPVHVYSHGYQGFGGSSAFLMRHFASHGWVVIAPEHTDNTLMDHHDPLATAHYLQRPADISAVLDALEALPDSDPLSAADTARVVMSGHSFGTYTTWASAGASYDADALAASCPGFPEGGCTEEELAGFLSGDLDDPRVVAAIPMAGGLRRTFFGPEGHRSVHAPFLYLTGSGDDVGLHDQWPTYEGVDRTWVLIEGGCHQTFGLGTCSDLDAQVGFDIIDTYAMAFARRHLLGDGSDEVSAILEGEQVVSDLVTLQRGQ